MIYGFNNTIHRTGQLDIEVDEETGEIVSVWFRCAHLPFRVVKTSKARADEMRGLYKQTPERQIFMVEFEDKKND